LIFFRHIIEESTMAELYSQRLRRLHQELHNRLTHYRYNRHEAMEERYRRGRIDALSWLCALLEHCMEEERMRERRLWRNVEAERRKIGWLPPSPYRRGLEETLREFRRLYEGKE
jgi:hypothetical protein